MSKEELEKRLQHECELKGGLTYSQAIKLLTYTPYSFRSNSVRKRRAYRALLNFLVGYYHNLTQTNSEIERMIEAIRMAPTKLVTDDDTFLFSRPEDLSFLNLTEKKLVEKHEYKFVKEKVTKYVKAPDKITIIEEEIHKPVEGDTTDDEGWTMAQFDPDEMADRIGRSKPYSQPKWWYRNPVQYNKTIPLRIHHYLTHRHYLYDGDQVYLSELLERRFPRWVEYKDDVETRVREVRQPQPDIKVREIAQVKRLVKTSKLVNNCIKNEISGLKPNQKWVDEFVELTYKPGFSVIRGELLPYKRINEESYKLEPKDNSKRKRRERRHKRAIKKCSKKRDRVFDNIITDEELDEIIRENMRFILEHPHYLTNSSSFLEEGRKYMSWTGLRYMYSAIIAMRTGADAYDILRERVFNNYQAHKRSIRRQYLSSDSDY